MKIAVFLSFAVGLLGLAGCSTVQSRINEKAAIFHALDPQTQEKIRQGLVDLGYTTDMVYIAMGRPDEVREQTNASGEDTTWIYNAYWEQYEGSRFVGYRRFVVYDRVARAYRVFHEPVHADLYSSQVEERTRVIFRDGRVAAIEQARD